MSTEVYNGWTNYPTWNVKLWLDNEQGTQERAQELTAWARIAGPESPQVEQGIWTEEQATRFMLADVLDEWVGDMLPELDASFASDLLGWAMGAVNWQEIADNYLSES